jgi:hypothetical protein
MAFKIQCLLLEVVVGIPLSLTLARNDTKGRVLLGTDQLISGLSYPGIYIHI